MDMSVSYVAKKMHGKLNNPRTSVPTYLRTISLKIHGREGEVRYDGKMEKVWLDKKPLLWSIGKVVADMRKVHGIKVELKEATFSGTRQVIATVNTLAWVLGIKVNGKKQMSAKYDREPNITMPQKAY